MARKRPKFTAIPFGRFVGPPLSIVLLIVAGYAALTGRLGFVMSLLNRDLANIGEQTETGQTEILNTSAAGPTIKSPDVLRVATFNIEIFGKAKSENPEVMNYLALILRQFDVIAVQEIRSAERTPVDALLQRINASGDQYQVVLSERLGRTDSKEQYAYFWDATRVDLIQGSVYLVNDEQDFMHREPFVASFRSRRSAAPGSQPFSFTMINVHTDPDETTQELNVLDDVFQSVRAYEFSEDDFILVGDLNVESNELGELGMIHAIESLNREKTNTAGSRCIDHIIIDRSVTTEWMSAGVIHYERDLQLTREQADLISDHRPVWAAFDINEHAPRGVLASRPTTAAR
ncbi:MAG: endonuclease/exonuclease/phosphatase family protein [Pirellulaceae bacterium]